MKKPKLSLVLMIDGDEVTRVDTHVAGPVNIPEWDDIADWEERGQRTVEAHFESIPHIIDAMEKKIGFMAETVKYDATDRVQQHIIQKYRAQMEKNAAREAEKEKRVLRDRNTELQEKIGKLECELGCASKLGNDIVETLAQKGFIVEPVPEFDAPEPNTGPQSLG